jgi:hypothetical protein
LAERLRQPGEHHEIGVKTNALDAADAEERQPVAVLQAPELTLDRGAAACAN